LDPLIHDGVMPNLAAFCRAGARAVLRSTPIPITPQAWTSMATGRSPGHFALYDFIRIERKEQGIFWRVTDSRDNHCETLWHYASRQGKRVSVLNYFGIAPTRAIEGHAMPGTSPSTAIGSDSSNFA
jgi:predicted AlkP superfamily phosphohydrolase/phosphomutase